MKRPLQNLISRPIITIMLLLLLKTAIGQVDIKVSILPPYPSKVTDYASRPQQVLIMLRSLNNLAQDIQLRGTITGDNGVTLQVDPRYRSPSPIHLNGGETRQLNGTDISQLFDYNQLLFSGISKDNVIRGNGLPEGNYQICIQAFNYTTGQPLSSGEPLGCSNVFPVSNIEPPIILSPFNDQPVSALTTQHFVISWTTPAGAPPATQYTISMVEILDGRNPNDAILSATNPLFFQQTVSTTNLLLYGPAMPALTPGRRYALMIAAKDPFNTVTFRNNGRSEVSSFIYGDTTGLAANGGQGTGSGPKGNLPSAAIKGRLTWYYRKSEETPPADKSKYDPSLDKGIGFVSAYSDKMVVNAALSDPSFVAAVKPATTILTAAYSNQALIAGPAISSSKPGAPTTGVNIVSGPGLLATSTLTALKSAPPTAAIVPSTTKQIGKNYADAVSIIGGGIGGIINNDNPAFFNSYGSTAHPMAGTIFKVLATDTSRPASSSAPQLVGAGITDDQGNFQLSFIPPAAFGSGKGYSYTISIQENYFTLPEFNFSFPPDKSTYDLGEIRALANTYRLLPFAASAKGDSELVSATIDVYRKADFYNTNGSLRTEGNIEEGSRVTENINGQSYIKVSTLRDGYTGTRLFFSNANGDEYKVKVTAQDFSTYTSSLSITTALTRPTAPRSIRQVYKLATGPTTFSGTVNEIIGQGGAKRPLPGATVVLYLTDSAYYKATHLLDNVFLLIGGAASAMSKMPAASLISQTAIASVKNQSSPALSSQVLPGKKSSLSPAGISTGISSGNSSGKSTGFQPVGSGITNSPSGLIQGLALYLQNGQMTTTSDSSGAFTFSNVPVNPNFMKCVVSMPGGAQTMTDSVLLTREGSHVSKVINFTFISYVVTGRIVDEKNQPIPNALFVWASGGSYGQADANGYFVTSNKAGSDTLIVKKLGYQDRRVGITIKGSLLAPTDPPAVSGSGGVTALYVGLKTSAINTSVNPSAGNSSGGTISAINKNFIGSLQATPTFSKAAASGTPITAAGFGFGTAQGLNITPGGSGSSGINVTPGTAVAPDGTTLPGNKGSGILTEKMTNNWIGSLVQPHDNPSGAVDLGSIVLKKRTGRMLITVLDAGGSPLNKASILIDGTDSTEYTTPDGTRFIEGPGGDLLVNIGGPSGSSYAPQQVALSVNDVDTAKRTIRLAQGARLTGHVTAAGKAIAGADVGVEGLDYLHAVTDNNGYYSLVVSKDTSYTFRAAKSGFVSSNKTQSFHADGTMDFALGNAGFDITKLLGFTVQVDKIEDAGSHKKISGSFINIPGNSVFTVRAGTTIPFSGVEVEIRGNIPVPVTGSVTTDITQLNLKAFTFLPVKLTNNGGALVISGSGAAGDAGQLQGIAAIDYAGFMPSGITSYVDASVKQFIQQTSSATPQSTVVLNSSGTLTASSLAIGGASGTKFNLYGFTVTLDLAGSSVNPDGLHLKGSINLGSIPLLNNTTLQIKDLWVGTNGYISGVSVNMDPAPGFSIAGWGGNFTGLSFNDNGFSVSGNIKVQIPGSKASQVDFANLSIAVDQLYGGSFTIPASGIDVFGIVKFLGGSTPLSFGKLGSSSVYYLGGSGTVQFPSVFGSMNLKFFQVQTNGQFAATVPVNINEDFFGLAKVGITDIGFRTINGFSVDIQGNFSLNAIPFIKANVGGIHFGSGGSVSVDDIGLSFDLVGIAAVKASIQFVNQPDKKGFSGSGSITIVGLAGIDIGFSYFKVPNGISVAANFRANISIPIGGVVSINNPGGGFSLNTGDGSWMVTIVGDASITGLGAAVAITNMRLTVSNGPVIKGSAGLSVLTVNVANASMVLDIPKSLFALEIKVGIALIPKVVTAEGSAIFALSAAKNDTYFLLGAQFQASLLGIFNSNANITAGWGVNLSKHPEYSEYTDFIDPTFLDNGVVKGVYLQAISNIGFKATGDIFIAKGSIWFYNNAMVKINMGIGAGNYGLDVGASWDCGGSLSVPGLGTIASVDIGTDATLHMSYVNNCFNAGGSLAAHLVASIGNCDDDCFTGLCMHEIFGLKVIPEGAKICVHPGLKVDYDCNSGFHMGIDL